MEQDYKETERIIIREHGDMLLVRVKGLFMDKYPTTSFELWNSREAYEQKKYRAGNQIFCANLAVSEETALSDWEKIVSKSI